jgi:hypothetical protein
VRRSRAIVVTAAGALAVLIGCFLTWVTDGGAFNFSGFQLAPSIFYGDPFKGPPELRAHPTALTSAGAMIVVVTLLGVVLMFRRPWAEGIAGVVVLASTLLVVMTLDRTIDYSVPGSIGPGLIIMGAGGLVMLVGAVVAEIGRRGAERRSVGRLATAGR